MANEFWTDMPTKQYASTLDVLSQEYSVLFQHVWDKGKLVGAESYFNQLDAFDMTWGRARYADTAFTEPTYGRRRVIPSVANVAVPLDSIDMVKTLVDPKSDLARQGIAAAGRAKDQLIWAAMYGAAYAGPAGGTSTAFDFTNQVVDVNEDGAGGSTNVGLNIPKINAAVEKIMLNSVNPDDPMNELTLVISPAQRSDWLNITTLTSTDYMTGRSLATGKLDGIAGIKNVVISNMVPYCDADPTTAVHTTAYGEVSASWLAGGISVDNDSSSHRACALFAKSALGFGTWENTEVLVDRRADKNNIWQLWIQLQCGVTRLEEGKVVLIECQE